MGDVSDYLRWLTNPNTPWPGSGQTFGGNTFGGNTFGGNTFGSPTGQAPPIPPDQPGFTYPTNVGPALTNPQGGGIGTARAAPSVSIQAPTMPSVGTTARVPGSIPPPAQLPASPGPVPGSAAALPVAPQPAIMQGYGRGPATPNQPPKSPGASALDNAISAVYDRVTGFLNPPASAAQQTAEDKQYQAGARNAALAAVSATQQPQPPEPMPTHIRGQPQTFPKGMPQTAFAVPSPQPSVSTAAAAPSPSTSQGAAPAGSTTSPSAGWIPPDVAKGAVPMGTGPGHAVLSHEQAAALAGGAGNLGSQIANNPDIMGKITQELMGKGMHDPEMAWLALAQAGFGMMASNSPFIGQAIGQGAQAGLQAYNQMRNQRAAQLSTAADLTNKQQQLQQTGAYQQGQLGLDQQKIDLANQEYQTSVDHYAQEFPLEQALKMAQADYYKAHGAYWMQGPGGSKQGVTMQLTDRLSQELGIPWPQAFEMVRTGGGTFSPQVQARIYSQVSAEINNDPKNVGLTDEQRSALIQSRAQERLDNIQSQVDSVYGGGAPTQQAAAPAAAPAAGKGGMPAAIPGYPAPGPNDVKYIRDHPDQARNYDNKFGPGAAAAAGAA